ncbi:hypothetical protein [uncultured Jatrophihabitans sp.]|uniref:hypothetical protein n=1 Tax=uncultured Jatrophihabitans sp. TaxID=1610747 RepID=UPI0035CA79F5
MPNPLALVEAPDIEPYRYGLASVAQEPPADGDPHWQLGVQYEPVTSYLTQVVPGACQAGTIALPSGVATEQGAPFSVYAGVDCKIMGYTEAFLEARALAILEAGWQHAAEQMLWQGGPTGSPLTGAAPVLNAASGSNTVGTGLSLVAAIGALEKALASAYSGRGVIHSTRDVAALADRYQQLHERDLGVLETALGTRWAFGGGYDGTGPSAAAPAAGTAWLYATGTVVARRARPFISGGLAAALNRTTNQADVFAEQPTVLTVDGPTFAVSVDLTK